MDITQMKDRMVIELECDVTNSKPHKARRSWIHLPAWPKGTRFILRHWRSDGGWTVEAAPPRHRGNYGDLSLRLDPERFMSIINHAEEATDVHALVASHDGQGVTATDILSLLLRKSKVSMDDIRSAARELVEDDSRYEEEATP